MASAKRTALQHRVWRWHFLAGLMVVPFVVILAVTGAIYLFKPQYDAAVERSINAGADPASCGKTMVAADLLVHEALARHPGASLIRIVLPVSAGDPTAEIEIAGPDGARTLWLDKTKATILHDVPTGARFMNVVKAIHGSLLGGNRGSLIVEIMASWTVILVITGLFLWWPRKRPWWRLFVPELKREGRRGIWKDVHGTAGAWMGVVILIMLFSGLPWTQVWGEGFTRAKALAGLKSPGQEWFVTLQSADPHALHEMGGSMWETDGNADPAADAVPLSLVEATPLSVKMVVEQAIAEGFAPPVWVQPPRGENGVWTVRGMNPNRFLQETVHYDRWTGAVVMRIRFGDHNIADQVAAVGLSFHEGALFGWLNQFVGVLAALAVAGLAVTGAVMWWKRRPPGRLGVPPMPTDRKVPVGMFGVIVALCLFLPMAGVTLLAALAIDMVWSFVARRLAA